MQNSMHFSILPIDWDMKHSSKISDLQKEGKWTPCDVPEVVESCGSLFPYITTKTGAIRRLKGVKKEFPYVTFGLYNGKTFGELQIVQEL